MLEKSPPPHRRHGSGFSSLAEGVLELLASGQASTRTELAALLGAAPSTVSFAVGQLLAHGLVAEEGTRSSTGGGPRPGVRGRGGGGGGGGAPPPRQEAPGGGGGPPPRAPPPSAPPPPP